MLSLQEMFDKAYIGVVKQGIPSKDDEGCCMYRGDHGAKCGVGHLIPDDVYAQYPVEAAGVTTLVDHVRSNLTLEGNQALLYKALTASGVNPEDHSTASLLMRLQAAHDAAASMTKGFIEDFQRRMATIAADYNLTIPEVA